jgi:hypothetical protein
MARLALWAAFALAGAGAGAASAPPAADLMALLHGHGRHAPAVDLRLDADAARRAARAGTAGRRLAAATVVSGGGQLFVLGVAGSPAAAAAAAAGAPPADLAPAVGLMVLAMQAKFDVQEQGDLGTLWNALFWCACLAAAVLVIHVLLRALVVARRARMPGFLEYPSIELLVLSVLLPLTVAAAAPFYKGTSSGQVAAAVVFGALVPAAYLACVFYLVVKHLALAAPGEREALFLLDAPAAAGAGGGAGSDDGSKRSGASLSESLIGGKRSDAAGAPAPAGAGAAAASAARPPRGARALALLDRFLFTPVFGWHPAEAGAWVDTDPGSRFTARWGVLFAEVKGPRAELVEDGGAEGGAAGRPTLRAAPAASRRARAREVAQVLGVAVEELKVVLFANLLAGTASGADPAAPLAILLSVTALAWLYLRVFSPPATRADLAVAVLETLCDAGSLAAGVALAVTAPTDFGTISQLGLAMLTFQVVALFCTVVPRLAHMCYEAAVVTRAAAAPPRRPALAAVVAAAMARDPACLARKYGRRWLRAARGRELGGRALAPAPSVLPFRLATLARAASAAPARLRSAQRALSRRAPEAEAELPPSLI